MFRRNQKYQFSNIGYECCHFLMVKKQWKEFIGVHGQGLQSTDYQHDESKQCHTYTSSRYQHILFFKVAKFTDKSENTKMQTLKFGAHIN